MNMFVFFRKLKCNFLYVSYKLCIRFLRGNHLPRHIAFVADGNRTYARQKALPLFTSYLKGMKMILRQIELCKSLEILAATFFIFSLHNWSRNEKEVDAVLTVVAIVLKTLLANSQGCRYQIIGNISALPTRLRLLCDRLTNDTKCNDGLLIILAINYSGKFELANAVVQILHRQNVKITEDFINSIVNPCNTVNPELIIRTSTHRRISDFFLWQSVESYWFFTSENWPEFSEWSTLKAILYYQINNYGKRRKKITVQQYE